MRSPSRTFRQTHTSKTVANLPYAYKGLIDTLEVLARDSDGQVEALKTFFDWIEEVDPDFNVDELALDFNDFVLLLPQVVAAGLISPAAARSVEAVDNQLDQMSGEENAELWTVTALRTSPEWTKVRELARNALGLFKTSR